MAELIYEKLMSQEELIKIKGYLESGDSAKHNIALAKIDTFLLAYLKDLKYEWKITTLARGLAMLEALYDNLRQENADNIVIKTIVEQFRAYKETREKIKGLTDIKEKERQIRALKSRNLWEV